MCALIRAHHGHRYLEIRRDSWSASAPTEGPLFVVVPQGAVGPPGVAVHLDKHNPANATQQELLDMHLPTFVEMALLSQAR